LSFATSTCWKTDFIEFEGQEKERLPNIYGQEDLSTINSWIMQWRDKKNSFIDKLKEKFNAIICKGIDLHFTQNQEKQILNAFTTARKDKYQPGHVCALKAWKGRTKYGTLLELRPKGIRVFFVYYGEKVIIGGSYIKGAGNDNNLESKAAQKAIQAINNEHIRISKSKSNIEY
jgi:hypothetical protein